MSTTTASGRSELADVVAAVTDAWAHARRRLPGVPQAGFVFARPSQPLEAVRQACLELAPDTHWLACHSGGGLTEEGVTREGLVMFLVHSTRARFHSAQVGSIRADPAAAAARVCEAFPGWAQQARDAGLGLSTTVALVDGLAGVGEPFIRELRARTRTFQQIVGGASSDDRAFRETPVAGRGGVEAQGAVVLHAFDRVAWGIGVEHGLAPATPRMIATRSEGTRLFELNGRSAFESYRSFAAEKGIELVPESAQRFLIANELGVFFLNQLAHVRSPLFVGPDGSLEMIAQVPVGSEICILEADPSRMISAATTAAREARKNLQGQPVAGVLVFDCICRRMLLGKRFGEEVDAIREVFPDVPLGGFVTYGEVARFAGRLDGWHNATVVVAAIPA
jgi:hypothetical protein